MSQILDSVAKYFESDGWRFEKHDEDDTLCMTVRGDTGAWRCVVSTNEEEAVVFFFSVCPIFVPADYRVRASEYLMRVNRRVFLGHFIIDFDSGEVRYETTAPAPDGTISDEVMKSTVGVNCNMMDRYLPGLFRVVYSEISPADAFAEVREGKRSDQKYRYN